MSVEKLKKYLKVQFTDEELLSIGRDLAAKHTLSAQLELEHKDVADSFKAKLSKVASEVAAMSNDLSAGYHFEQVECELHKDYDAKRCTVVRLDTGEVVEDRPMSADEMQIKLQLIKEGEGDA